MYDGHDYASVLVKTREGRPIKIDANKSATNARIQASVLSLYDSGRLKNPMKGGIDTDWRTVDTEIIAKLNEIKNNGGKIAILSSTIISSSTTKLIADFSTAFGNVVHVQMDAVSYSGMLDANEGSFGVRVLPTYNFDKADVIVSFGADFLGNWLNADYATQYAAARNPKSGKMAKHYQVESTLTLTGSNADDRVQIKPSEQAGLLSNLYSVLNGGQADSRIAKMANDLAQKPSVPQQMAKESINRQYRIFNDFGLYEQDQVLLNLSSHETQNLLNNIKNKLKNKS